MGYNVINIETCLMDGMYRTEDLALDALSVFEDRYKNLTWAVRECPIWPSDNVFHAIPENRELLERVNNERGG